MKTFKIIQNAIIVIGIITAVALVDQIEVPVANLWSAIVIISFSAITIVGRELRDSK